MIGKHCSAPQNIKRCIKILYATSINFYLLFAYTRNIRRIYHTGLIDSCFNINYMYTKSSTNNFKKTWKTQLTANEVCSRCFYKWQCCLKSDLLQNTHSFCFILHCSLTESYVHFLVLTAKVHPRIHQVCIAQYM